MNQEKYLDNETTQKIQNYTQDQRMQDIEQNYNANLMANSINISQTLEDTELDIKQVKRKLRRTRIEIIIVIIILLLILLYKFWFPFIRDNTPIGTIINYIYKTETITNEVVEDEPVDTPDPEDDDTEDVPFDEEKKAYMVNMKLATPELSLDEVKMYSTKQLRGIAKDKNKQVVCTEFYSSDGKIYDKTEGNTKYYSFDDVLKQVDDYTNRISLTQVTVGNLDGKSKYTNFELVYNIEVGAAAVYDSSENFEFYGYSEDTVNDFADKLEKSKNTVEHDGIMISVKGSGVNPNRVSQAIAKSIPSVRYINYDATYIGLELVKNHIIYKSFEGDIDITEKVIKNIEKVSGVDEVIVGTDETANTMYCVTTDITIPNDLNLIIENHLY